MPTIIFLSLITTTGLLAYLISSRLFKALSFHEGGYRSDRYDDGSVAALFLVATI